LRRWPGVELFIAAAMVATVLALFYRQPLITRTIVMDANGAGSRFDAYAYDDSASGGLSKSSLDPQHPLSWRCKLVKKFDWPYCGLGLLFDRAHAGRGLDLSGYDNVKVKVAYDGPARFIRVVLKDHNPAYRAADGSISDKTQQVDLPVSEQHPELELKLVDFAAAEWWKQSVRASSERSRPEFKNIVSLEFVVGADGEFGEHRLNVSEIQFERKLISTELFYGLIGLCWVALIGGMLLVRRRQIARLKESAENALRQSERLYRNILETSTDCIILFDSQGRFGFVNAAGIKALELPPIEETRGKHWSEFWTGVPGEVIGDALHRARVGETVRLQGPGPTAKGTQRWWDAITLPMLDESGVINGVLSVSRDVTLEREQSEELKWASEHDALTHLPNRRSFQARLQAATIRAMQAGDQVGLLLIDLDHFKHVNDSLGHSAGDDLLTVVGERLRHCVRDGDFVARIGGDEFAILLERGASEEALLRVGGHVQERLRAPVRASGRSVRARASIGGALFPSNANTADDLFKYADTALYELKQNGRGGTRLFDNYMLAQAEKTVSQLNLARGALTEKTVVPLYQPKIDIASGEAVGLEALLRWRHPRRGLQLPATLEEAFNDYELAAKIGDLMQQKVARDIRRWLNEGVEFGRVSINAAPAEFLRDDYAERFLTILNANDVPACRLEIEVTEHAFLGRGPEYVARALNVLKQAGTTVSLDDFGTGCSSLAHLRDFPVDVVKVDKSFVQQMTDDPEIAAIVAAVIDLANSLQISVVAEGVETPAQLELLRVMGCRIAQGHLYAAAVSAEQITRQLPRVKAAA
jgi:diguanylate cyclase (GGDEF)-like protein/PAS domain S-box-containing protein